MNLGKTVTIGGSRFYEVSANDFVEAQTERLKREFNRSRPFPRNWAMGFKGSDKPRRSFREWDYFRKMLKGELPI